MMDPLGRALFETAVERVRSKKLVARIEELETTLSVERSQPPPRHRPSSPVRIVDGEQTG